MLRGHYRKSLFTLLLFASVPGLVIGLVLFVVSTQQIEHELQQAHQKQMLQTVGNLNDQFSYLERSMAYWAFDPQFTGSLQDLDFVYGYEEIHEIYRTLLVMEGSHPLVESVELYLNGPKPVVFTKERYYDLPSDWSAAYETLMGRDQTLFWFDKLIDPVEQWPTTEFKLIHKISGSGTKSFGVLVMHLNKEKVQKLMETMTPYQEGTTFLVEEGGGWLFTTMASNEPTPLDEAVLAQVQQREGITDTFLFEWENKTYSVNHGKFSRMGDSWIFASAAPLTSITAPVIFLSKLILIISGSILLFAVIASWFASRSLYSPIDRLMKVISGSMEKVKNVVIQNEFELIESRWNNLSRESQTLQQQLDQQLPNLREGFLLQLLHGHMYSYSEQELMGRMEYFGREVHDHRYCIVFIQLSGFSKLEGRFSAGDEGLVTFVCANMVEELVQNMNVQADVINFHDLTVGLLVSLPNHKTRGQFDEEVYQVSKELIASIGHILHMHATICISRTTDSIKAVPVLFEETKLAISFRMMNGSNQIIDIEKLEDADRDRSLDYPFDLERQVLHAIRTGKENEASDLVVQFMHALSSPQANEAMVKQGMLQLLGSIMHVVLQSGLSPYQLYEGTNLYERLGQIREPEGISEWFNRKVIHPFIHVLSQKQSHHMHSTIEKVVVVLQEQYKSDISLDYCADTMKISPFILSKMFKEIMGINFIDFLTNIRLDKARELLRETDLKISEVAEEVGYQHSYFNRLFKKQEGVTPSQYREMSRSV
jgi:AraC-like DNA-binding protein